MLGTPENGGIIYDLTTKKEQINKKISLSEVTRNEKPSLKFCLYIMPISLHSRIKLEASKTQKPGLTKGFDTNKELYSTI